MDRRELMAASLAVAMAGTVVNAAPASAKDYGLKKGPADLKSVGPIAFGPAGILFVADPVGAKIYALDVGTGPAAPAKPVDIDKLDTRLAAYLGGKREEIFVRAMAVQPLTHAVYLSVMRGSGADGVPALVKVDAKGDLSLVSLKSIAHASTEVVKAPAADDKRTAPVVALDSDSRVGRQMKLPNGPAINIDMRPLRTVTVTGLAYVDGTLLVAGASNEEFSSAFRRIAFPFSGKDELNSLKIFHVSHGKYETAAPITTFIPYGTGGMVLAAYTCTPLVQFSLNGAAVDSQVNGKSVADLGAVSTPLDMVSFKQGGQDWFLVSNTRHPLMKIARSDIDKQAALTHQGDLVGATRHELPQKGVTWMSSMGDGQVLMVHQDEANALSLRSYAVESL
jgi:hypothetical protein